MQRGRIYQAPLLYFCVWGVDDFTNFTFPAFNRCVRRLSFINVKGVYLVMLFKDLFCESALFRVLVVKSMAKSLVNFSNFWVRPWLVVTFPLTYQGNISFTDSSISFNFLRSDLSFRYQANGLRRCLVDDKQCFLFSQNLQESLSSFCCAFDLLLWTQCRLHEEAGTLRAWLHFSFWLSVIKIRILFLLLNF